MIAVWFQVISHPLLHHFPAMAELIGQQWSGDPQAANPRPKSYLQCGLVQETELNQSNTLYQEFNQDDDATSCGSRAETIQKG